MRILLVTLVLLATLPAYGSIIFFNGVSSISPPASIVGTTSDTTIFEFAEQQGVVLGSNLTVGFTMPGTYACCAGLPGGTVPAGDDVNSYVLYAAPTTNGTGGVGRDFKGSVTFSPGEHVVGVIAYYKNIFVTDSLFGAPGTTYPGFNVNTAGAEGDTIILGANLQAVFVDFRASVGNIDMIRILTETTGTPEPAEFLLIGSGLVALGFCKRRSLFGR